MSDKRRTFAVIDGNSLMHRAFHAVPPTMNAPDGRPTNAIFGFLNMFLKMIDAFNPDGVVVAFDKGKPRVRMEMLPQYKAQRPPMDPDLHAQFPMIKELLAALNVPILQSEGWEGDDILGTMARLGEEAGCDMLLVTGDRDMYQLVTEHVNVVSTRKGLSDVAIMTPESVDDLYHGITPALVPDFYGLKGDTSDNIPGVPGIGPKKASALIAQYGSLDEVIAHADEGKGKITDMLAEQSDVVIRFQGGANAGHTIICDYGKFALHQLPSGVFYPHTTNIIGNGVALDIRKLVDELIPAVKDASCEVVICTPYTDLVTAVEKTKGTNIHVGAENVHFEKSGAFTGEISADMLVDLGVEYVIVGHSERRQYFAETDQTVNKRALAALNAGLKVIICVGESLQQREEGVTEELVRMQTKIALRDVTAEQMANVVIAYEPIWAIGTGKTATADQAEEVCGQIRKVIGEVYGEAVAEATTVQYGGSMNAKNCEELLSKKDVDGGLIGGASLKAPDFAVIVNAATKG